MDAIRQDPAWENGEYKTPPPGLKTALDVLLVMGNSPLQMQKQYLDNFIHTRMASTDANDFLLPSMLRVITTHRPIWRGFVRP